MTIFNIVPVVTEKSTLDSQRGAYHFYIPANINKIEAAKQLEKMYGAKVESVKVINVRSKKRTVGRSKVITRRRPKKKIIVTFADKKTIDINAIKN